MWQNFELKYLNDKRLANFVMLVLVMLITYSLINHLSQLLQQSRSANRTAVPLVKPVKISTLPEISHWHLFGISPVVNTVSLPTSNLQFKLIGVLTIDPANMAQAIIEIPGQETNIYRIGDSLPGGVVITQIAADSIVLSHNDRLEVLPLQMFSEDQSS